MGQVDYLPTKVKEMEEAANAAIAALEKQTADNADAVKNAKPIEVEEPVIGSQPEPDVTEKHDDIDIDIAVDDKPNELEELRKRFDTLQGKYNKEVKALKDDVGLVARLKHESREAARLRREADERALALQKELAQIKRDAEARKPIDIKGLLTEEDASIMAEHGLSDDALKIIAKVAAKAHPQVDIEEKLNEIDQRIATSRAEAMTQAMQASIPNYEKYFGSNCDAEFVEMLDQKYSELSDETRRDALQRAVNSGDIARVKKGITDIEAILAANKKRDEKPRRTPNIDPSESVSHSNADRIQTGAKDGIKPNVRSFSAAEVRKFYDDLARGAYAGNPKLQAKAEAIEKLIMESFHAGKIT